MDLLSYFLNTSKYNNYNEMRINNWLYNEYNNNLIGGNDKIIKPSYLKLILGIVLIVIGITLLFKNDWTYKSTIGYIVNRSCDDLTCKINLIYTIDGNEYSKIITTNKLDYQNDKTITLYYDITNPNIILLHKYNYIIFGILLGLLGGFVIINSGDYNYIPNYITEFFSESQL